MVFIPLGHEVPEGDKILFQLLPVLRVGFL